eukprot:gene3155-3624_t
MAGISDMPSQLKEEKKAHQVMKEQVDNLRTSIPNSKCRAKKAVEAHDKKKRNLKVMFQIQKQQLKMFKEFIEEDEKSKNCIDSSLLKRVADIEEAVESIRIDVVAKRDEEKKEEQSSDEVATLQENLKRAEKKISELERIVDAKDKRMMVYEQEFSRHRLETKRYSDESRRVQVELQETNEIVNEMQGVINDREEEIAKYIDFVTKIAGKVKESNEEACELRQQLAKKEEELELLQKNISDFGMQVEAKKGPCCTELALRDQQIKALEVKVAKTGEEKLEMDKQIESLLDELAESMSAHAISEATKEEEAKLNLQQMEQASKNAEKKTTELERIVDAKNKKMMIYEQEFSRNRHQTKKYSDEAKRVQVELQETNEIVNEMQGVINDREEEIAKYIDFVTEIAGKVKESNEEACELKQQLAKKEDELKLLQKNISDLEMQVEAKKGPCCTELALRDQQIKALEEKVTKTGEEKLEMDKQIESLLDELAESMSAHAIGMAAKHEEVAQLNMQLTENSESMEVDKPDETSKDENVIGSEWPMKEKQCKMTVSSTEADSARKLSTYDKGDEN